MNRFYEPWGYDDMTEFSPSYLGGNCGGCLRGMGKSMLPTVITLLGSCAFRLVYVYTVFAWNHQFQVLMWAYPITWTITGSAMLFSYFKLRKSLFENQ